MAYEALLLATVSASPTAVDPTLLARVQGGTPSLSLDVAALAGAADQLDPTRGPGIVTQVLEIGLSGTSAGVPFELTDHEDTADGIEVDRGLTDKTTWSLKAAASSGRWIPWALGYEVAFGGAPPPGLARINVAANYGRGVGAFTVPLVTGGLATSSSRGLSRSGHGISLSGFGPEARYDRKRVTLQLPPNHGLTHGAIARLLATEAGVPGASNQIDGSIGFALTRALDMVEEELWTALEDVLLGCGYVPRFDESGALVAVQRAPVAISRPDVVIVAGRLLGEEIESALVEGNAEVVTCVRVEGVRPVIPENQADGTTTEVQVVRNYQLGFLPRGAYFSQTTSALTPLSPNYDGEGIGNTNAFLEPTDPITGVSSGRVLKDMVIIIKTKSGGCLLTEETLTCGWKAPEAGRYSFVGDVDGTTEGVSGVYIYEAGATFGDSSAAYRLPWEVFTLLSRELKVYEYGGGSDGHEQSRVTTSIGGWMNPMLWAKAPIDTFVQDWPAVDYEAGRLITGSGRVVTNDEERFCGAPNSSVLPDQVRPYLPTNHPLPDLYVLNGATAPAAWISVAVTDFTGEGGYLVRENTANDAFAMHKGSGAPPDSYWYAGNFTGPVDGETFQPTDSTNITNAAQRGDTTYRKITVRSDAIEPGDPAKNSTAIEDLAGYLPAIPRCDPEDNARKEGEPFKAELCRGLQYRLEMWQTVQSDFVENEFQAGELADVLLRELQGIPVTVNVPFYATIRPGMTCLLSIPDVGVFHTGWVDRSKAVTNGRFRYSELGLLLHAEVS